MYAALVANMFGLPTSALAQKTTKGQGPDSKVAQSNDSDKGVATERHKGEADAAEQDKGEADAAEQDRGEADAAEQDKGEADAAEQDKNEKGAAAQDLPKDTDPGQVSEAHATPKRAHPAEGDVAGASEETTARDDRRATEGVEEGSPAREEDEALGHDEFEEEFEEAGELEAAEYLLEEDIPKERASAPAGALGARLGLYFRGDDTGTLYQLSPLLAGWVGVAGGVHIGLDWGFAFGGTSPDGGDASNHLVLGNPFLFLRRVLQEGRTEIRFGIGLSLPASSVPGQGDSDFLETEAAYRTASAMRGRYDHWLWMPEQLGLVFRAGADTLSKSRVFVGGETALAILIPSGDYHDDTASVYLQGSGEIGFGCQEPGSAHASKLVARLQLVSIPIGEDDRLQMSIGPAGRVQLDSFFLDGSLMVNLDPPDGVFGDGRDIWGVHLGGGMNF